MYQDEKLEIDNPGLEHIMKAASFVFGSVCAEGIISFVSSRA